MLRDPWVSQLDSKPEHKVQELSEHHPLELVRKVQNAPHSTPGHKDYWEKLLASAERAENSEGKVSGERLKGQKRETKTVKRLADLTDKVKLWLKNETEF